MVGFKDFLYGLGTAGDTFTKIMLRAQERAQDHERQKELLGIRKGGSGAPGVAGMGEREIASNERAAIAENEMLGRDFASRVGSKDPVPFRSGALPDDEARVLQRRRVGDVPSAETGRSFASFDLGADRAQRQEVFANGDAAQMRDPSGDGVMFGSFTKFMDGFRNDPGAREAMYPSAMLEADIARNPFTKDLRAAQSALDTPRAKMVVDGVRRSGVDAQGDILSRRLAGLDNAAIAEAGPMVGRALAANKANASTARVSEAGEIAAKRTALSEASSKRLIGARDAVGRERGMSEAISASIRDMKVQNGGVEPTDEEILAAVPGARPDDIAAFRKAPRGTRPTGRGESPEITGRKTDIRTAASSLASIAKNVRANNGRVSPGEIDGARQAYFDRYETEPSDQELAVALNTTVEQIAAGESKRGGKRPTVGARRGGAKTAPVAPTKTSTPAASKAALTRADIMAKRREMAGKLSDDPATARAQIAEALGRTPAEVQQALKE